MAGGGQGVQQRMPRAGRPLEPPRPGAGLLDQELGAGDGQALGRPRPGGRPQRDGDAAALDQGQQQRHRPQAALPLEGHDAPRPDPRPGQEVGPAGGLRQQRAVAGRPAVAGQGLPVGPLLHPLDQPRSAHETPPR